MNNRLRSEDSRRRSISPTEESGTPSVWNVMYNAVFSSEEATDMESEYGYTLSTHLSSVFERHNSEAIAHVMDTLRKVANNVRNSTFERRQGISHLRACIRVLSSFLEKHASPYDFLLFLNAVFILNGTAMDFLKKSDMREYYTFVDSVCSLTDQAFVNPFRDPNTHEEDDREYNGSVDVYNLVVGMKDYIPLKKLVHDISRFISDMVESSYGRASCRDIIWQCFLLILMVKMHIGPRSPYNTSDFVISSVVFVTNKMLPILRKCMSDSLATAENIGISWLHCCGDLLAIRCLLLPIEVVCSVAVYVSDTPASLLMLPKVAVFGVRAMEEVNNRGKIELMRNREMNVRDWVKKVDTHLAHWIFTVISRAPPEYQDSVVEKWKIALLKWTNAMDSMRRKPYTGKNSPKTLKFWESLLERFAVMVEGDRVGTVVASVLCLAAPDYFKEYIRTQVASLVSKEKVKLNFNLLMQCGITPYALTNHRVVEHLIIRGVNSFSRQGTSSSDLVTKYAPMLAFLDSTVYEMRELAEEDQAKCVRHVLKYLAVTIDAMASALSRQYHSSHRFSITPQDYTLLYLLIPFKLAEFGTVVDVFIDSEKVDLETIRRALASSVHKFAAALLGELHLDGGRRARLREEEMMWLAVTDGAKVKRNHLYGEMSDILSSACMEYILSSHRQRALMCNLRTIDTLGFVIGKATRYLPVNCDQCSSEEVVYIPLFSIMMASYMLSNLHDALTDNVFDWPDNTQNLFFFCDHIVGGACDAWNVGPLDENNVISQFYQTYFPTNRKIDNLLVDVKSITCDIIIRLNEPVNNHSLSLAQLRKLDSHLDETTASWAYCKLEMVFDPQLCNLHEKILLLESFCSRLNQLYSVLSWLSSLGLSKNMNLVQIPTADDLENEPCVNVVRRMKEIANMLGTEIHPPLYELDNVLTQLCYFISSGSNLYSHHFSEYIAQHASGGVLPFGQRMGNLLHDANTMAIAALRRLLETDDISLSDFAEGGVDGFMQGLCGRSKEDVLKELKIITDFMEPNTAQNIEIDDVQSKMLRVKHAVKLLRIQSVLGKALDACMSPEIGLIKNVTALGSSTSDLCDLDCIRRDLETPGAIKLSQVSHILVRLQRLLNGLEVSHLQLLAELANCHQLLVFLQSEKDFEGQLQLHTQDMQGTDIGEKVLTDLDIAHRFLKSLQLTEARGAGPGFTLSNLTSLLISAVPSEADALEKLAAVTSASEHMAEISLWFSGGSAIFNLQKLLSMVRKYLTDGTFISILSDDINMSSLQLRVRRTDTRTENVKSEVLVELVRGVVLSRGEASSDEDRQVLDSFLRAYDHAQRTHNLLIRARLNSVPHFYNVSVYEISLSTDSKAHSQVELEISQWYEEYTAMLNSCKRLHFLSRKQIMTCLHRLLCDGNTTNLSGYVRMCFPDIDGQVPSIFEQLVSMLKSDSKHTFIGNHAEALRECLRIFCETLNNCNQMLLEYGLIMETESYIPTNSGVDITQPMPVVIKSCSRLPHVIYTELIERYEGAPLPSQVLWCTHNTTADELRDFVSRASAWPSIRFAFMNVNMLRAISRDVLLEACLDTNAGLALHPKVFLFFSGDNGLDAFSVLRNECVDDSDVQSTYLRNVDTASGMSQLFPQVNIISGGPCVGKSTYIRDQLKSILANEENSKSLTVSVHENFLLSSLTQQYTEECASATAVGLHINVFAHSVYRAVDKIDLQEEEKELISHLHRSTQFLHALIHCGLIVDDLSGTVVQLNAVSKHYFFLELPSVLYCDGTSIRTCPAHNTPCESHIYASHLSPAVHAKTLHVEVNSKSVPFKISEAARLVAYYVDKATNHSRIDEYPTEAIVTPDVFSDADARNALEVIWNNELFVEEPNYRTKDKFIRLMIIRIRFLIDYVPFFRYESQESRCSDAINKAETLAQDCMKVFLQEVISVCSQLSGDWSKAPCAFTVRYNSGSRYLLTCLCGDNYLRKIPQNMVDTVMYIDNACDNPALWGELRREVAFAYQMADTNRALELLQAQNYILTPDFAVKLLVLKDLHDAGSTVVLQGSTGTGKTEQIQMLSLLLNNGSDLTPMMTQEMYSLLSELVDCNILSPTNENQALLFENNGELRKNQKNAFDAFLLYLEDASGNFIDAAGPVVANYFLKFYKKYKYLRKTGLVKSVLRAFEGTGDNSEENSLEAVPDVFDIADAMTATDTSESAVSGRSVFKSCGEMLSFLREISSELEDIFFVIRMHEGITANHWRQKVSRIECAALRMPDINIVAFVDELNTSVIMGMVKEVMIDGTMDGRVLPSNIFWVGATNPVSSHDTLSKGNVPSLDLTLSNVGIDDDDDINEYIVRSLLPSFECTVLGVGSLAVEQEKNFLAAYLFDKNLGFASAIGQDRNILPYTWFSFMRNFILASQEFVRKCGMHRTKVSIRDLMRTLQLYQFFLNPRISDFFIPRTNATSINPSITDFTCVCWCSLCLSVATVYYLRLSSGRSRNGIGVSTESGNDLRSLFVANLFQVIYEYDEISQLNEQLPFLGVFESSLLHVFQSTSIPAGIAPTRALQENVFACVTCFSACLPVIITGPPGCGKTLAMQIVLDNMKGASSPNSNFQRLKNANRFTYQCSEGSAASEIKAVYENALQRHSRFTRARIYSERCVVCLDEASLPRKRRAALKVTHYYLDRSRDSDRPVVSTIMLTNRTLDAAKTNRAVQLLQSMLSSDDLYALVKGCLMTGGRIPHTQQTMIRGLCNAFQTIEQLYDIEGRKNVFQLRDFIFFLRYLRRGILSKASRGDGAARLAISSNTFVLSAMDIVASLRRNFNGMQPSQFENIVKHFLRHTGHDQVVSDPKLSQSGMFEPKVLETLRESLDDSIEDGENPNHSAFRHIMIIDKTDTECGISLLFDMKFLNPDTTDICHLADFSDDTHDRQKSELAARIKYSIEQGRTVILSNAQSIYSAFYDLFNKHYSSVRVGSQNPDGTVGSRQYYANIGIGSLSRPCIVHPKARVIVHVTRSEFAKIQLPFLNRFEKYSISLKDVVSEKLCMLSRKSTLVPSKLKLKAELFKFVMDGVRHFVSFLGEGAFYGVVADETIAALILRSINDSVAAESDVPLFQSARHVSANSSSNTLHYSSASILPDDGEGEAMHIGDEGDLLPSELPFGSVEEDVDDRYDIEASRNSLGLSSDPFCNIDKYIRTVNFQLLQLVRPEVLFARRKELPRAYLEEALQRQEHFSAVNLIRGLSLSHWQNSPNVFPSSDTNVCTKWTIFTRTSSELLQLPSSFDSQKQLLPVLIRNELENQDRKVAKKMVHVVSLSQFHRSMDFEDDMNEFFTNDSQNLKHRRLLVLIADRGVISSSQVSFVMRAVGSCTDRLAAESRPLVVIIQHFSVERTHLKSVYDALPFAGWDMYYVDSFGYSEDIFISTRTPGAKATRTVGKENNWAEEEKQGMSASRCTGPVCTSLSHSDMADIRSWMLVAYGLKDTPSKNDAIIEFSKSALSEIKYIGSNMYGVRRLKKQLQDMGISRSLPVYLLSRNSGGGEWLHSFFSSRTYLLHEVLSHVTSAWGSVLHRAVSFSVSCLSEGRSSLGMMDHTRVALANFLKGFVRYVVVQLANDYGLESLAGLPVDSEGGQLDASPVVKFVILMIRSMHPPSEESLKRYANSNVVTISLDSSFVCETPLFHFVDQALSTIKNEIVMKETSAGLGSDNSLHKKLELEVQSHTQLDEAIRVLSSTPMLHSRFIRDYIRAALPHILLTDEEMDVLEKVLLLQENVSLLMLYAEPKEEHILVDILAVISPLKSLSTIPNSRWNVGSVLQFLDGQSVAGPGNRDSDKGIVYDLESFVSNLTWDALLDIVVSDSCESTLECLKCWVIAARDLGSFSSSHMQNTELLRFLLMQFIHTIVSQYSGEGDIYQALVKSIRAHLRDIEADESFSVLKVTMSLLHDTVKTIHVTDQQRADVYRSVSSVIFDSIFRNHSGYTDTDLRIFVSALLRVGYDSYHEAVKVSVSYIHSAMITSLLYALLADDSLRFCGVVDSLMTRPLPLYHGLVVLSPIRDAVQSLPSTLPVDCIPDLQKFPETVVSFPEQGFVDALFSAMVKKYKQDVSSRTFSVQLTDMYGIYTRLSKVESSASKIGMTASAVGLVTYIASSLSRDRDLIAPVAAFSGTLQSLFSAHPVLIPLFVASFGTDASMMQFLGDQESVISMGLPEAWFMAQEMSAEELFRCPPCMISTRQPLSVEYAELRRTLHRSDLSAEMLCDWARDRCVDDERTLNYRMMLTLASYHETFSPICNGNERGILISRVILECLEMRQFQESLSLTGDEQSILRCIAQGPHDILCSTHDGLMFYFSRGECQDKVSAMHRTAAVNTMAMILGSRRNACYYYNCCFHTEDMHSSQGLGSGWGRISKDCGYQTTFRKGVLSFDDHAPNPAGAKFGEIVSMRAINNYFIWIAFAWGAWVRMDRSPRLTDAYTWTTTYPDDYAPGCPDVTDKQRILGTIYARAYSFLSILQSDPRLNRIGVDFELYISLCSYHTALKLSTCTDQYGYFSNSNLEDATNRQKKCMKYLSRIWNDAEKSVPGVRKEYLQNNVAKVESIIAFKRGWSNAVDGITSLPDKAAIDAKLVLEVPSDGEDLHNIQNRCRLFIASVLGKLDRLNLNLHLPIIVHFYKWVHKNLSYRVCTTEQYIPINTAIDKIDDAELRRYGHTLFNNFLVSWNYLVQTMGELNGVCPTAAAAGEAELPPLQHDSLLCRILSTGEPDAEDVIMRLMKNQIGPQNELLDLDEAKELLSTSSPCSINPNCTLVSTKAGKFHLLTLPPSSSTQKCPFLAGVEDVNVLYNQIASVATRPLGYRESSGNETSGFCFDYRAAAVFLIRLLISGKPSLVLHPRPAYFTFIPDVQDRASQPIDSNSIETCGLFDPVCRVLQLTRDLRKEFKFHEHKISSSVEITALLRQIRDESTSFQYVSMVSTICEEIIASLHMGANEEDGAHRRRDICLNMPVRSLLSSSLPGGTIRAVAQLSVRSTILFAESVCRVHTNREYMFSSMQHKHMMAPLSPNVESVLRNNMDNLLSVSLGTALNGVLQKVQELIELLTSASTRHTLLENQQHVLLNSIPELRNILTGNSGIADSVQYEWAIFISEVETVRVENVVAFLRILSEFCSKATAKLTSKPQASGDATDVIYAELVPEDMQVFQSLGADDIVENEAHSKVEAHSALHLPPAVLHDDIVENEAQSKVEEAHSALHLPPAELHDDIVESEAQSKIEEAHSALHLPPAVLPCSPPLSAAEERKESPFSSHMTSVITLGKMWGSPVADLLELSDRIPHIFNFYDDGENYFVKTEDISSVLNKIMTKLVSISTFDKSLEGIETGVIVSVLRAHDVPVFSIMRELYILVSDSAVAMDILGGDADVSDGFPIETPELGTQTSVEIEQGFRNGDSPCEKKTLTDTSACWNISVDSLIYLAKCGILKVSPPPGAIVGQTPVDVSWTVEAKDMSEFNDVVSAKLIDLSHLQNVFDKVNVVDIVRKCGIYVIEWGMYCYITLDNQDRATQACIDAHMTL